MADCKVEFYIAPQCTGKTFESYTKPVTIHVDYLELEWVSAEEYAKLSPPMKYTCRDGTPVDEAGPIWTTEELAESQNHLKELIARLPSLSTVFSPEDWGGGRG